MRYYDDEEEDAPCAPAGYCESCGKGCTAVLADFGIGVYEYCGARGLDRNEQWVSPCCEVPVLEEMPEPLLCED